MWVDVTYLWVGVDGCDFFMGVMGGGDDVAFLWVSVGEPRRFLTTQNNHRLNILGRNFFGNL